MSGTKKTLLVWRKNLLQQQWWLPQPIVQNAERTYLFQEETRHSIMIEWYFADKKTLKNVIENNDQTVKDADKILWYYDAAQLMYEYAYQKYKSDEPFRFGVHDIKTAHSLLMKITDPSIGGTWRSGDMMIVGADIQPAYGSMVWDMMQYFLDFIQRTYNDEDIVSFLATTHCLFESIHPFADGNGRVWRMLLNYILVMHGYPTIIIKWNKRWRDRYIHALEQAEQWLLWYLPWDIPKDDRIEKADFTKLMSIIYEWLFVSLDTMILAQEDEATLVPVVDMVTQAGYTDEYARKIVARGHIIAKKIGTTRYSKPEYFHKPLKKKS